LRSHSSIAVIKEFSMSKGQHGNKEAKKPKKPPAKPVAPVGSTPLQNVTAPPRPKR
jgi:hypothetical protein